MARRGSGKRMDNQHPGGSKQVDVRKAGEHEARRTGAACRRGAIMGIE